MSFNSLYGLLLTELVFHNPVTDFGVVGIWHVLGWFRHLGVLGINSSRWKYMDVPVAMEDRLS